MYTEIYVPCQGRVYIELSLVHIQSLNIQP